MAWYSFIGFGSSDVFSPKVSPDPDAAKRLADKFEQAQASIGQRPRRTRIRTASVSDTPAESATIHSIR